MDSIPKLLRQADTFWLKTS